MRRHVAQRGVQSVLPVMGQVRYNNSFIKQVMEQVKRDMEQDEKGKKDWDAATKAGTKAGVKANVGAEKLSEYGEKMQDYGGKFSEKWSAWRETATSKMSQVNQKLDAASEDSEALRKAKETAEKASKQWSEKSSVVGSKFRGVFNKAVDKTTSAFGVLEEEKAGKLKDWRANRVVSQKVQEEHEAKVKATQEEVEAAEKYADAEAVANAKAKAEAAASVETAVVVSDRGNSSWDRFGAGVRDMPFLSAVFENPFLDRMLGESEIAACIREMKEADPNFFMEDFAEDIEYVVAPHIVRSFLEGDAVALKMQCGEAAFAAVNSSISARTKQKLTLDQNILAGPKDLELKGAKMMDKGSPSFIWTFNTQQINCLTDKHGEVVEGAIDDIRTVYYAMVVTRHPDQEDLGLEYPWLISELAILGNQQCF